MSFIIDFNNELKTITSGIPGEVTCIDAIIKALKNGNYPNVMAKKLHQRKCTFSAKGMNPSREICDIFLILRYKDYYRFTFIQNKSRIKHIYNGLDNFTIDAGQHYLLVNTPPFTYNNVTYNVLTNSVFDTVTSYSVFYKNSNGDIDFDFSSANSCVCSNCNSFSCCNFRKKQHCTASHKHWLNTKIFKNQFNDFISLGNIQDIESNLHFGEVVKADDEKFTELSALIFNVGGKHISHFLGIDAISAEYMSPQASDDEVKNGEIPEVKFRSIVAIDMRY